MSKLIDTHVHLDDSRLRGNLAGVLDFAWQQNVQAMINVGHDLKSSIASIGLAAAYKHIWATVGIHPHSASSLAEVRLDKLAELATRAKVVAIGEIGLDYHYDFSPRPVQRQAFALQLDLAKKLDLPVIIHQREAVADALSIIAAAGPLPRGGVMHCFSETPAVMARCLALNLHIGLGGIITFPKAQGPRAAAATVPLERLLLETDCPYLTPHPHRGKVNQPGYLPLIADEIAALRAMDKAELAAACTENARLFFRLEE